MTDDSGILEELRAEREELERMIKIAKNITKEEVILSSAPFFSLEEKDGKLLITGIALAEGVWKNVLYPAEEIEKSAVDLVGKPLKVEHGLDANFEDKNVGKVLKAYYDKALKSIVFQAEVTDPEAIKLIKNGTFPAVSCSTWVDKLPVNPEQSVGFNLLFNELSLVRTPACEKCFIFAVEELSKKICQGKQDLNNKSPQVTKQEVKTMTEEKEEVIEELEEEVDLTEMEKPKLYAVVEAEALTDFDEALAKKVVSYYYGYYYPYYYKGKYPYPGYPYYPYYPYYGKYPGKKVKGKKGYPYKKPEKKSLWALLELESPEEIETLKKAGKKVVTVYYGYYGYPYKGYPYYGYYYPYYPYYPYYYPYYGKRKKKGLALVEDEVGEEEAVDFDTMEELNELAKKKKVKKYYYEYPYEYKCPEGQVWDEKEKKCVEQKAKDAESCACPEGTEWDPEAKQCKEKMSEELSEALAILDELALPEEYIAFMKKCMKESTTMPVIKRMKECAEAFKKQAKPEEKAEEYKCPEGQIFDEKEKKCVPVEKKEAYPAPEQDSSREWTDIEPGRIKVPPGPAEHAEEIAKKEKLGVETVKKEEQLSNSQVETPMAQEPCKDCPKKEGEEASTPKEQEQAVTPATPVESKVEEVKQVETPKVEAPTEEPKVETPKAEPPKEEPKVETPKVEEKPVEKPVEKPEEPKKEEAPKEPEKKEPTEEELKAYVKEHWAELLLKLHKEKKF